MTLPWISCETPTPRKHGANHALFLRQEFWAREGSAEKWLECVNGYYFAEAHITSRPDLLKSTMRTQTVQHLVAPEVHD